MSNHAIDARASRTGSPAPMRVLFMQSQSYFGSDSMMHSLLMRYYDRSRVTVYAACNRGEHGKPSPSLEALQEIPDLNLRPMRFGPTVFAVPVPAVIARLPSAVRMSADLVALAAFIRQQRIDVIHGTEKPRDAFYGVMLARLTGAKSVVHLHVKCDDWMSDRARWALAHADAIVGVSRFVAESAIARGYPASRVTWMLNGIDAAGWDPDLDGAATRRELGIDPDEVVITIAARMFKWKGHLSLLRALARLGPDTPAFRVLIVGKDDPRGAPGLGIMTAQIRSLAAELGLGSRVILPGFRSDMPQILAASDIYAMPSFEEPCAVAFLEAMAMRKPIVALDSGGTPEIVPNEVCGLLSQPEDIDGLAANLGRLIKDPGLRRRLGTAGRAHVETSLTPQRMASDGISIYRRMLAAGSRSRAAA